MDLTVYEKNRLTAIMQYSPDHQYAVSRLQTSGNRFVVKQAIEEFYQKIRFEIVYEDCLIDVYVSPGGSELEGVQVFAIEFSPFGPGWSDAGLYCWDKDRDILMNEKAFGGVDMRVSLGEDEEI